ncbi:MAG: nodulation protein NfeD [Thermoplasmata archaeon]|nr:nodulation protein NfeD [Thermoplasmata archaeon]
MKRWAVLFIVLLLAFIPPSEGKERTAYVVKIDGLITQGTVEQFERSLDIAGKDGDILIVMLDTNGGLSSSMEKIIEMMESSPIPVIIYVAPPGAKAFSAGTFLLMASHVAAMANATTIGACHPRIITGTGLVEDAGEKETNAYAAMMKSLAASHGRNESMAIEFVKNNTALNEREAMEKGVIEMVARDVEDLLEKLDGKVVEVRGENYTINTSGMVIKNIRWGMREKFINYLSDPQVASLLLTIGIFGLIFGFLTPGFHFPETMGAILIILALYGLSFIGMGAAGILLLSLAFIFFVIEAHTPTFGFWTAAAIITFIFGIMLLPAGDVLHEMPRDWYKSFRLASIMVAIFVTTFFSYAVAMAAKTRRKKPRIGENEMVGKEGVALTRISPEGQVKVDGKIWKAVSEEEIEEGEKIVVEEQHRLTLKVKKI